MLIKIRTGLLLALFLGLAAGCAKNPAAPGRVSGTVKYKGQALPAGNIYFHSQGKGSYRATLAADGTYEITDIPAGEMVVTVETESLNPSKKAPTYGGGKGAQMYAERMAAEKKAGRTIAAEAAVPYVKIPEKYAKEKTSPLTATIKAGKQVMSFDLTD